MIVTAAVPLGDACFPSRKRPVKRPPAIRKNAVALSRGERASSGNRGSGGLSTARQWWNPLNQVPCQCRVAAFYLYSGNPVLFQNNERFF